PPPSETSQKTEKKLDHWTNDQTDVLVSWLSSHPADCHILFYKNKGGRDPNNKLSAKDKTGIHDIIAQHVFGPSQECAEHYTKAPKNPFSLCKVFIKHYGKLNQTGQGILSGDGVANTIGIIPFTLYSVYLTNYPIELVCKEFLWYDSLFGI
ncbi:hypothetical protein PAXRUDRAFT_165694, partial [Paxillus rubicundulus Ve08.2h10]